MYVFGKFGKASFLALMELLLRGGVAGGMHDWEAETRYARPWRPVKPLLMIWLLEAMSAMQRTQRR